MYLEYLGLNVIRGSFKLGELVSSVTAVTVTVVTSAEAGSRGQFQN